MPACTVCELHAESTFHIEGMDCREEVAILERRFKGLRGLETFTADVVGQKLHVKYDAAVLSASDISGAVADTGMRAWLEHEEPVGGERADARRRTYVWVSGAALGTGLVLGFTGIATALPVALFFVSIASGVAAIGRRTWNAIRRRSLDINVLMMIAV